MLTGKIEVFPVRISQNSQLIYDFHDKQLNDDQTYFTNPERFCFRRSYT